MSTDESKQEETKQTNGQAQPEHISEYKRQKNIISGIDNGHLALGVGGAALIGVGILAFPHLKEWFGNITNKQQQQLPPPPPVEEPPYIPPTPPVQQPVQEPAPQPQEQQQQQEQEIPDTFYDDELQKRRQLLTGRKHLKYDSQFGAGIANS